MNETFYKGSSHMTTFILEEWHEQQKNFNLSDQASINQLHEFIFIQMFYVSK